MEEWAAVGPRFLGGLGVVRGALGSPTLQLSGVTVWKHRSHPHNEEVPKEASKWSII